MPFGVFNWKETFPLSFPISAVIISAYVSVARQAFRAEDLTGEVVYWRRVSEEEEKGRTSALEAWRKGSMQSEWTNDNLSFEGAKRPSES